ncbi:hypothetical protein [Sorangium sp. So ce1099]|uniref:hypothetical protein n=1 Tax=Sorangium sp. So ce1099 TaxID=3133331 RepID=UPI003F638878
MRPDVTTTALRNLVTQLMELEAGNRFFGELVSGVSAVVGYEGPCAAEVIVACRRLVSPQLQVFGHSIAELSHRCPPG